MLKRHSYKFAQIMEM